MIVQSRAAEIERARQQKATELRPEQQSRGKHTLQVIEDDKTPERTFCDDPAKRVTVYLRQNGVVGIDRSS